MPECKSCGGIYHFLEDYKGKIIPVNESSMTNSEISAVIGKMKVLYNPARHIQHLKTCMNNLKINKRKDKKDVRTKDDSQSKFDF